MHKVNPAKLFGFLTAVLVIMGGLTLMKGALLIGKHEADTLHLLQIVFRMAAGQWPHLDFMTPIGALAFAPIAFFMGQGAGVGHAIIYAQIGLGIVLLPMLWWVGVSRLQGVIAYGFGAMVLVLAQALVFGLSEPTISISMYYNRWAWAISFVVIVLAILPVLGRGRPAVDGGLIGLCMAALVMLKMTYFVAFAPAVIAGLVLRRSYKSLGFALFAGLVIVGVVTLFAGFGYWQAYLGDLLTVARSDLRPQPGESIGTLLMAPTYLAGTLAAVAGAVFLRQSDDRAGGVGLLLLVPGFIYVTFQNFGNDAQWLGMLAILLFSMRPQADLKGRYGWSLRGAINVVGVVALTLAAPTMFNLAASPYRHLKLQSAWYEPILPANARHTDLRVLTVRTSRVEARMPLQGAGLDHLTENAMRGEAAMLQGQPLARCKLVMGLPAWVNAIAQDLQHAGLTKGKQLFVADAFFSHWMFSDLQPLQGGAPWYYGGLSGFEAADYLLVPLCPAEPKVRRQVLDEITKLDGITLTEIRRTGLYVLLDIERK